MNLVNGAEFLELHEVNIDFMESALPSPEARFALNIVSHAVTIAHAIKMSNSFFLHRFSPTTTNPGRPHRAILSTA